MTLRVVAGAIVDGPRLLAALRGPGMSSPNLWELPGGKVEPGESDADALIRELREELGITVEVGRALGHVNHGRIELHAYLAVVTAGTPTPLEHAELRWVDAEALERLVWAPADRPFLGPLAERLARMR